MSYAGPWGLQHNGPVYQAPVATKEESEANRARIDAERLARADRERARMIDAGTWTPEFEKEWEADRA